MFQSNNNSSAAYPSNNGTQSSSLSHFLSVSESLVLVGVQSLIIVVILLGNVLVILSVFTYRPLHVVQNYLIVSLAVADMLVAMTVLPFNVMLHQYENQWLWGRVLCDIWLTCDIFFCTASILNLCAIALDRYFAVRYPVGYAHRRNATTVLGMIGAAYVLSAIISIPPLIGWRRPVDNPNHCRLTDELGFVIYSACGSFFIPSAVMIFVYCNVFRVARARLRKRARLQASCPRPGQQQMTTLVDNDAGESILIPKTNSKAKLSANTLVSLRRGVNSTEADSNSMQLPDAIGSSSQQQEPETCSCAAEDKSASTQNANNSHNFINNFLKEKNKISLTRERKAARTLGVIMGTFILCWLPFFLMYFIAPLAKAEVAVPVELGITWLGYLNSALNPVIYTIFNQDFRKAFSKLLSCS